MKRLNRWSCFVCLLFVSSLVGLAEERGETAPDENAGVAETQVENLVKGMADYLAGLDQFACEMTSVVKMTGGPIDNEQTQTVVFRLARPNKLALIPRADSTGFSLAMASDGETIVSSVEALSRHTRQEAPETFDEMMANSSLLMMAGPAGSVIPYGGDLFYTQVMMGVEETKYLGIEKMDGQECHHCRLSQDALDWEIWIQTGDKPLPRKFSFDMSKVVAENAALPEGMKIDFLVRFDSWNLTPDFSDDDFRVELPEGSEEVENLFGDVTASDDPIHPLLGKEAPGFETKSLDGEVVKLSEIQKDQVVVLDFWASWCGPCVAAMPEIEAIAKKYADQNVQVYAINVGEDPKEIKEFLEAKEIDVNVLLDVDGEISDLYKANAIPQTVLIGKTGIVEAVHVGMSGDMQTKLAAEIDELLDGKKLAEKTIAEAEKQKQEREESVSEKVDLGGTKQLWNRPGNWSSVAFDKTNSQLYAIDVLGKLSLVQADGSLETKAELLQSATLRAAKLAAGDEPQWVAYSSWGETVKAFSNSGAELWEFKFGQGVDDVCTVDLDGDGLQEVVIGYNGMSGIRVLNADGTLRWKYDGLGNVWHVTAGDIDGDGEPEVITTSAMGQVHVFDSKGMKLKDMRVPIYANFVRVTQPSGEPKVVDLLVSGAGDTGETLLRIDAQGTEKFSLALPCLETKHVDDISVASDRSWAAVAVRGGLVHVVDLEQGEIIASVAGGGLKANVTWQPRTDQSPLLVVASDVTLTAYEVTP